MFSPLPSHGTVEIPDFTANSLLLPYDELLFALAFKVVPLNAVNQLDVSWVLPPMKQKVHAELHKMRLVGAGVLFTFENDKGRNDGRTDGHDLL